MDAVKTLGLRLDGTQITAATQKLRQELAALGMTGKAQQEFFGARMPVALRSSEADMQKLGRAAQGLSFQLGSGVAGGMALTGRATAEGIAALRSYIAQAHAAAAASGTLTAGQVRLAAASKAASAALSFFGGPIGIAVIAAILAAKKGWDEFTKSQAASVERSERNIEVQTKLTAILREQNEATRDAARARQNAEARLGGVLAGGDDSRIAARLKIMDQALEFGRQAASAGRDGELAAAKHYATLLKTLEAEEKIAVEVKRRAGLKDAEAAEQKRLDDLYAAMNQLAINRWKARQEAIKETARVEQELSNRAYQQMLDRLDREEKAERGLAESNYQRMLDRLDQEEEIEQQKLRLAKESAERIQHAFEQTFHNIVTRGEASFADLFAFLGSAGVGGPAGGVIFGALATLTEGIIGFTDRADEAHERWVRVMEAWHESLDEFVERFDRTRTPLQDALDDIADFYEQRLRELEPLRHRLLGSGTSELNDALEELEETIRKATQAANDAANAEKRNTELSLLAELARAKGNDAEARRIEREMRLAEVGSNTYFQSLLEQIFAAEDAAQALDEVTERMEDLRNVVETLSTFQDSLRLGPLSPLSPMQQLGEARRQFETMLALASAGDRTAAQSLPGSAEAFLSASRTVNASSAGYVADFLRVQSEVDRVRAQFQGQLSAEEQTLKELQGQSKNMKDLIDRTDTQIGVLSSGFTAVVEQLTEVVATVEGLSESMERTSDVAAE